MIHYENLFELEWHYNEAHTKCLIDGFGGTIKRVVSGLVKSNKITINSEKQFPREALRAVPLITSIYVSRDDEIIEPSFVRTVPKIDGNFDVYHVKRCDNAYGVCFIEFRCL